MRPRSTLGPRRRSNAGSTVSDPAIAQKTTSIVPMPIVVKIALPAISIPAIAISTVAPETSTACPDVRAVRSSASRGARPRWRSSRSRRR